MKVTMLSSRGKFRMWRKRREEVNFTRLKLSVVYCQLLIVGCLVNRMILVAAGDEKCEQVGDFLGG